MTQTTIMILKEKRLANVGQGIDADDAVVMHQMASLDTGLETKLSQLKADSLQVDGSSHMTGDLDLRGQNSFFQVKSI